MNNETPNWHTANPTVAQLCLLNIMGQAIYQANSIEPLASQDEGEPYYHLWEAMHSTLTIIFVCPVFAEHVMQQMTDTCKFDDLGYCIAAARTDALEQWEYDNEET